MYDAPETRQSLLVRLRESNDRQAWEEFAEIYGPLIYRLARGKGFQHADALDVSQEVFSAVHKAIQHFDPVREQGTFRGWLNRITRNLMINALARQKGPLGTGDTEIHSLLAEQPAPAGELVAMIELEYQRELFRVAAERVRPDFTAMTWRAFWLTAVEGQSIKDVARLLGKTYGAVRISRCRVLARLRREVASIRDRM